MGHRALVAYERPGDGYTVRYSHWGARGYRLLESVTASTPLGGRNGDGGDESDASDGNDEPTVRPEPLGVAIDLDDVARSFVDPLLHEGVFVVSDAFCTRAFEPLAFWGDSSTTVHGGALVELRRDRDPCADARELRAWRRGATAMLAVDGVAGMDESPRERHERLVEALRAEPNDRALYPIPPDGSDAEP